MRTAVARVIWRLGYRALVLRSFIVKPRGRGAKCALFNAGEVLLVRHSYGPKEWEFPGGGLHRGEEPLAGVRRELKEELGVEITDALALGVGGGEGRFSEIACSYFAAEVPDRNLKPDPIEIAEVAWCDPAALPSPIGWHAAQLLARREEALASRARGPGSPGRG